MTKELEPEAPAAGLSVQEYLAILRRRRAIILQAFVLIAVVGVVVTLLTRPVYHASAKLLVDGISYNLDTVDTSNPLSQLLALSQEQSAETQVEVLQTKPLLDQVTREVGPASLSVSILKDTNVIQDDAEAGSPQAAANAANRLLELYVAQDSDQNLAEIRKATDFVQTQGAQARKDLDRADADLKQFKQHYHVADIDKNRSDQIARVAALTDQAQKGQADRTVLEAQVAAARSLLAQQPQTLPLKLAATNAVLAGLRDDIAKLRVQRTGMVQRGGFTAQADPVVALDAQIAALSRQLAAQPALTVTQSSSPNAVHEALRAQLVALAAQKATLATQAQVTARQLAQAQAQVGHYADWQVALDRLNRRHDQAQAQDKMFSDKLTDLQLRDKARHATARIIERAQPPTEPVRPRKAQSLLFAALIGLFVGLCLALLQEFLDDRINTAEDAERLLALPSLGHVPALSAADARLLPQMQGLDPAAESYRILRTNIHFASIDAPARTLVVTSSNPGEGKTTTAANLGFAMAMDGKRVVLVDTDLRRPSLHKLLDLPTVPGLTDVLLGHATLDDVLLEHGDMPGLMVLTCGSTPPNPSELLGSRRFRDLTERLMGLADLVIFDSPPVLVAADAQILASQMDGTVLVLEAGETKKGAARRTLDLLRQARANVLGVAYNKMRLLDGSGYYYYHYHYAYKTLPGGGKARPGFLPAAEKGEHE